LQLRLGLHGCAGSTRSTGLADLTDLTGFIICREGPVHHFVSDDSVAGFTCAEQQSQSLQPRAPLATGRAWCRSGCVRADARALVNCCCHDST
jgi:hypothetical protein